MNYDNLNDQLMVMAAHRYCLGRQSYIVSCCLEWLRDNWADFAANTKQVMIRDTIEALMDGLAGGKIDTIAWKNFASFGFTQLTEADRERVQQAVAWKQKPWPLT